MGEPENAQRVVRIGPVTPFFLTDLGAPRVGWRLIAVDCQPPSFYGDNMDIRVERITIAEAGEILREVGSKPRYTEMILSAIVKAENLIIGKMRPLRPEFAVIKREDFESIVNCLKPFAAMHCSPTGECQCNNCKARDAIAKLGDK
jgi:hypothetical protein